MERSWSKLSENISCPVVYGRSVSVSLLDRYLKSESISNGATDVLTGVGSRDVYASKNTQHLEKYSRMFEKMPKDVCKNTPNSFRIFFLSILGNNFNGG